MCNLYNMMSNAEAIRRLFRVSRDRTGNLPLFPELFPGYDVPVVRAVNDERELTMMGWGFVLQQQGKAPKRVNITRAESALGSQYWRDSFGQRRCLVPATAFCEWTQARPKRKIWFGVSDGLFAFAGLWRHWRGELKGENVEMDVCSILTTAPNAMVAQVHPTRMPVILDPGDYDRYLNATPQEALALARPFPAERMTRTE